MRVRKKLFAGCAGLILVLVMVVGAGAGPIDAPGFVKAFSCSACHGLGGASPSDTMPILAGMAPAYFKKTIEDYASGKRFSPEMGPFSKMVLELGADDVAAYFAGQEFRPTPVRFDAAAAARGRAAATPCVVCHGADGRGDPAKLIPSLAGQPAGYLRNQMLMFKREQRSPGDDALKAIKTLMRTISDETFADLAAFYSSLR